MPIRRLVVIVVLIALPFTINELLIVVRKILVYIEYMLSGFCHDANEIQV